MGKTITDFTKRTSTVYISKRDKEALQKHCKEIQEILDKYPFTNDLNDNFITTMMRVKHHFDDLSEWVNLLDEE